MTFSGLVLILAELERTKKDLAALKERHAELTQEYDKLLKEYAKAQVGGQGWEMGVDGFSLRAGPCHLRCRTRLCPPAGGLGGVEKRLTWDLALIMRA